MECITTDPAKERRVYRKSLTLDEKRQDYTLQRNYGISLAHYRQLLEDQGGGCAICGTQLVTNKLSVDHDHTTGQVRGLLCNPCNSVLGMAHDSIDTLENAVKYLLKHWSKETT